MNIYIIARFIMCDGNINKNNWWKEKKVSKMDSIVCAKNQIVNTLQDIELANWTILSKNILEALEQKTYSLSMLLTKNCFIHSKNLINYLN